MQQGPEARIARSVVEHVLLPGADADAAPVVLLHGTGGDEYDLLDLAAAIAPDAARLGIRGQVPTEAGHAFFRRHPDRRIDEADLEARIPALAHGIRATALEHGLERRPVAIGYSNGAIAAAALLLTEPGLLAGAVLLRPLLPPVPEVAAVLLGTPVLILDGADDARREPEDGVRTAEALRRAGAEVSHRVLPTGHAITGQDLEVARTWIAALRAPHLR